MESATCCQQDAMLAKLIQKLKSWQRPLSCRELKSVVANYPLRRADLAEFVAFQDEDYCHQAIAEEPFFSIGCIGWRPGQASSTHDHRGSACCVQVVEGVLTNTDYVEDSLDGLRCSRIVQLAPGNLLTRYDRQVHRVSNDGPLGQDAISLHIYSPPLRPIQERSREQVIKPQLNSGSS